MSAEVFVNSYKAPETNIAKGIHGDTPVEEYDFNYCFDIQTLRSDRVELRPFLVRTAITQLSLTSNSLRSMPNHYGRLCSVTPT